MTMVLFFKWQRLHSDFILSQQPIRPRRRLPPGSTCIAVVDLTVDPPSVVLPVRASTNSNSEVIDLTMDSDTDT